MTFVQFHEADDIGNRFLTLLHRYDIHPPTGSRVEEELLSVTQLIEIMKNPNLAVGHEKIGVLRTAAGVHDLAAKVLSVETIPEFENFVPHLELIANTGVPAASIGQTSASSIFDDTARKMAELYMGCLAAHVGTQVVLDSPTTAKGDNPDVIFKVEGASASSSQRTWALAIKTISSHQGQTIFERIAEGANQIDDPKCVADKGMVVINAKNALDHDALWDERFPDLSSAMTALHGQLNDLADRAAADRPHSEWEGLFTQNVVRPVLFLGQSLVRLPTQASKQTPATLKMLLAYGADGVLDTTGANLASFMNDFMQRIVLGIPGKAGCLPR